MKIVFATCLALFVAMIVIFSRGRSDFHFTTADARGIAANTPVMWHNDRVGHVRRIRALKERFRVDVVLEREFKHRIHCDATVRITSIFPSGRPAVTLDGGDNTALGVLGKGVEIGESELLLDPEAVRPWINLVAPRLEPQTLWIIDAINSPAGKATVNEALSSLRAKPEAEKSPR